jgi:hypothetical protein
MDYDAYNLIDLMILSSVVPNSPPFTPRAYLEFPSINMEMKYPNFQDTMNHFSMFSLQSALHPIILMMGRMSHFLWHRTCNFKEISYT